MLLREAEDWGVDAMGYSCESNISASSPVVTNDD